MNPLHNYFASPGNAYAFALRHMEGPGKLEVLGISMQCYQKKAVADQWYNEVNTQLRQLQEGPMREDAL